MNTYEKLDGALSRSKGKIMTLSVGTDKESVNYAAKVIKITNHYVSFINTSQSTTKRVSKKRIRGLRTGGARFGRIR